MAKLTLKTKLYFMLHVNQVSDQVVHAVVNTTLMAVINALHHVSQPVEQVPSVTLEVVAGVTHGTP